MTLLNSQPLVLDKELARILGLNQALILQQVHYWININKKNNRNFHEGRYWTYNTIDEWGREFPFWSKSTIKRIFKSLREMKLIEVDNFNVYQMDRTLWYTIDYERLEKLVSKEMKAIDTNASKHLLQNDQMMGADIEDHRRQKDPMDRTNSNPPLPDKSSKTSSEISYPSINPSKAKMDRQEKTKKNLKEDYEKIIYNCELHSIDEKYRKAVNHAIRLLFLDLEKANEIRIGNNYIPGQIVRQDLKRLNYFVIDHAIDKFKKSSTIREIRNPVAYLKVLIYNSINELEIDMESKLRQDGMID